jgi:hypothetical protein
MSQGELDRLVAEGAIAQVAADPETVRVELNADSRRRRG